MRLLCHRGGPGVCLNGSGRRRRTCGVGRWRCRRKTLHSRPHILRAARPTDPPPCRCPKNAGHRAGPHGQRRQQRVTLPSQPNRQGTLAMAGIPAPAAPANLIAAISVGDADENRLAPLPAQKVRSKPKKPPNTQAPPVIAPQGGATRPMTASARPPALAARPQRRLAGSGDGGAAAAVATVPMASGISAVVPISAPPHAQSARSKPNGPPNTQVPPKRGSQSGVT